MKKYTAFIFAIVLSTSTFAGEYTNEADKQANCEELGNMSAEYFHKRGSPKAKIDKFLAGLQLPAGADHTSYESRASEQVRLALTYALKKATSEKNAYMHGWGVCMDAE